MFEHHPGNHHGSSSRPMERAGIAAGLIALCLLAPGPASGAAGPGLGERGRLAEIVVHGKALEGNLLGILTDRTVSVYLPPSYESSNRRYPSLYILHGIMDSNRTWTRPWSPEYEGYGTIQDLMDRGVLGGSVREMIVVVPDSEKSCHYTDSPVKGGWATFIAKDLVEFVDRIYRTIPAAGARGIMGHSMGGHGALKIAMTHPGTFGAVYAMNPSLLGWGGDVSAENPGFAEVARLTAPEDLEQGGFYAKAVVGIGQCFSPDPSSPLLTDLPFDLDAGGRLVPGSGHALWSAQMPIQMIPGHAEALRALSGLRFDSAFEDEFSHIPITSRALSAALQEAGVEHTFEMYNGDHRNRLWGREGRLFTEVLPFFSRLFGDGDEARSSTTAPATGEAQADLWKAAQAGDVAGAETAVAAGAGLDAVDTRESASGRTALNYAAWHDRPAMIRWLVARGADVNRPNGSGFTPLHHAAEAGSRAAAEALLDLGADPKATNRFGHTPLDTARRHGNKSVARLLEKATGT